MEIYNVRETLLVRDSDVAESRFCNAKLVRASFDDVNLEKSNFSDVNLTNASIAKANLSGMTINGVLVSDLIRAYENRET